MNTEIALEKLEQSAYVPQQGPSGANRIFDAATQKQVYDLAQMFARSALVRPHFRGPKDSEGHANCFMALSMAMELGIGWLQALNQIHVVKGNLGYSGQLYTALANQRAPIKGRIMYEEKGEGNDRSCTAWAIDKESGERVEYHLTLKEVMQTPWYDRNPLWKSITRLMLRYRAAAYLVRTSFPESMLGIQQSEELYDTHGVSNELEVSTIKTRLLEEKEGEKDEAV